MVTFYDVELLGKSEINSGEGKSRRRNEFNELLNRE